MSGERKIRIGLYGAGGRGSYLLSVAVRRGFEAVAVCDRMPSCAEKIMKEHPELTLYSDYDEFLKHDMDAVILANYATEHAPAAVKALRAGKHVISECMACFTMGEALDLVEAVEESGLVYTFAENYPYNAKCLEMKRIQDSGELGKFIYAEAEYMHPFSIRTNADLAPSADHWRLWLPSTYYCTHSIGPVMKITGTRPVRVSGFVVPHDFDDPLNQGAGIHYHDTMSVLMCQMDNGALAKIVPWALCRDHGCRVRICNNKGAMEYNQGHDGILRVRRSNLDFPASQPEDTYYQPKFPAEYAEALEYGHGGSDYFGFHYFYEAILGNCKPHIDVYEAIDMTAIGILGWKSVLNNSASYEIVDFRDKKAREVFRGDDWNPDPCRPCKDKPPCSICGKIEYSDEDIRKFEELHRK